MIGLLSVAGCGPAGQAGAAADISRARSPLGGPSRREDRVLISSFNEVSGVAVGRSIVFVATSRGLAMYDRRFDAWLPPLVLNGGFPLQQISAMAADPTLDAVWIAVAGQVLYYRPQVDLASSATVPGVVDVIAFDARDPLAGAFVRASGSWWRVSESGIVSPVPPGQLPPASRLTVTSTSLNDLYRQYPSLRNFQQLMLRDRQLRSWPVTSGAKSPDRTEVWLGTWGDGLFQVDPVFSQATHRPFGLLDPGAGAIALAADGVWVGGLGFARDRGGLTYASDDLRQWKWLDGVPGLSLAGLRARDLEVRGTRAWMATDHGLVRQDTRNDEDVALWGTLDGLPADQALAVAARENGAWVGTSRGLAFVLDTVRRGAGQKGRGDVTGSMLAGTPVRALFAVGDSLWIGSDAGLLVMSLRVASAPARASATAQEPRLQRPIVAITGIDSLLYVASQDELIILQRRTGAVLPRLAADVRAIGNITAMAADAHSLWIAGSLGVLAINRDNGVSHFLSVPRDLPSDALDVALSPEWAWVATRAGVVRVRRAPDGSPF